MKMLVLWSLWPCQLSTIIHDDLISMIGIVIEIEMDMGIKNTLSVKLDGD